MFVGIDRSPVLKDRIENSLTLVALPFPSKAKMRHLRMRSTLLTQVPLNSNLLRSLNPILTDNALSTFLIAATVHRDRVTAVCVCCLIGLVV